MPRTQKGLTSCDHKYPCACFCVDFNLVWQIIPVSSSLLWPPQRSCFWPSYVLCSGNISTVYVLHVRTTTFYWFFILCFIVVNTLHSVYAHQTYMRMYAVKELHECYCLRLIPVQKQVTIFFISQMLIKPVQPWDWHHSTTLSVTLSLAYPWLSPLKLLGHIDLPVWVSVWHGPTCYQCVGI